MTATNYLITGRDKHYLLHEIRNALKTATNIEIAVSFIRNSGLSLIIQDIEDAMASPERKVKLSLLTSDYMNITEPQALKRLMLLKERGADIRIFESKQATSFHLKSYIFVRNDGKNLATACAFVGSSNISKTALTDGIEWNYRINYPNDKDLEAIARIEEIREQYNYLLTLPQVKQLTFDWIADYEIRYIAARKVTPMYSSASLPNETEHEKPTPKEHQSAALEALQQARDSGISKGLVVLATGMGKTYLAGFDVAQFNAKKVLFVAHREEILLQAEASFLKILPNKKVGRYSGKQKDNEYDLLFASVQTIGQPAHLSKFPASTFDYIIVDEFHHAAANGYQRLLAHFAPSFMLGLTATPTRTDGSDILKLCDNNLIYQQDLFDGVKAEVLCPFTYYGIFDKEVDYEHLPWRNGKFDPEKLSNKLATKGRSRHVLNEWQQKAQQVTLAFCVSRKHADYMANYFNEHGIKSASVHSDSALTRSEALEQLSSGEIKVLFSVDLFNEGMDLPQIDTVLLLRPTESKILFLQQMGRGLRTSTNKERLVILDFVGNHHSFLNRPEMLLASLTEKSQNRQQLVELARNPNQLLPDGCYVNFDLEFIDFLANLSEDQLDIQYDKLKDTLGRRPTYTEFFNNGASIDKLRRNRGSWWEFVDSKGDLLPEELEVLEVHLQWFKDLAVTRLSKSYKLVLLSTLIEHRAFQSKNSFNELADWAREWYMDNPEWLSDLPDSKQHLKDVPQAAWNSHWQSNPIKFWCTEEPESKIAWFGAANQEFSFNQSIQAEHAGTFINMTQEVVTQRLAAYKQSRLPASSHASNIIQFPKTEQLPFFPDIKIACGHFKTGYADISEQVNAPSGFGHLDSNKHFIARASGNSMNGGKNPICDGDYLLLEQITPNNAGSISNSTVAIERQDSTGDNQYLLRKVLKEPDGTYILRAANPDYEDLKANDEMVTFARLKGQVDPLELFVGQEFMREDIPPLFNETFNPGNWQSGHVVLNEKNVQVLLVTLNKQGKGSEHQYHDYFIDDNHFHWQSQNSTSPNNKRGRELIEHRKLGSRIYLFIRESKLRGKTAAPFTYYGEVAYQEHKGEKPMNVTWELLDIDTL
ncbi:MAG: restriction endonuclease subunit R [Alteromonas sp.]|nr:restriction endonuclease subunit R [Alteromonas sp.]|tara:strand:- start:12980 stop:16282 length:3303 start_codon:yes stop_codon:yes gene_type:complete